jgi:hypothetical protein
MCIGDFIEDIVINWLIGIVFPIDEIFSLSIDRLQRSDLIGQGSASIQFSIEYIFQFDDRHSTD